MGVLKNVWFAPVCDHGQPANSMEPTQLPEEEMCRTVRPLSFHISSTSLPLCCHFLSTLLPLFVHISSTFVHIDWQNDLGRKAGHIFKGSCFIKVGTEEFHFPSTFVSFLVHIWFRHWNPAAPHFARVAANMDVKMRKISKS